MGSKFFGGGEQLLPLASALDGEARIAADDEPFAGEVVALDFGEVPLVEQGGVHRFVGDEFPDGGGAQGGDPAQPLDSGEILPDAGGGEHAPISHQDHAGEAEAEAELVHLAGHRLRVAGVAFEDFDGDGTPFGGAE